MKKLFLLATIAMLMSSSVAFANGGDKETNKGTKARTEKKCTKPCPQPCPPSSCCDKSKCDKG
jgi:hypothetical protein